MALQLMKLFVDVATTTEVTPVPERFFYVTPSDTEAGASLVIDAADFFDDTGAEVVSLPLLAEKNSYINVFVNGVLQMDGISTYKDGATTVGSLTILVPNEEETEKIPANSPIVLEVVNYSPNSSTTVAT